MKIAFDTEAYKTNAIAGPFFSKEDLLDACVNSSPDDAAYRAWAIKHAVAPESGSIVTTAYNPDLLDRRYATLSGQLDDFIGAKQGQAPTSGIVCKSPNNLENAVARAVSESPFLWARLIMISTTRENQYFDLLDMLPEEARLQTIVAAPSVEYADKCNELIRAKAPELSSQLVFMNNWQDNPSNVVFVNTALHYFDEKGLENLVSNIKDSGAKRVVFSDLIPNDDPNGAAQWKTQRYSGGVIPLFIPAKGALTEHMQSAGYRLSVEGKAPISFDLAKGSSMAAQTLNRDNFSYKLAL